MKPIIEEAKVIEEPVIFEVVAKYNHYKDKFQCVNQILNFALPN